MLECKKAIEGHIPTARVGEGQTTRIFWVAELIDNDSKWKGELLERLFNETSSQHILQIPILRSSGVDKLLCVLDKRGKFSVHSCCNMIKGEIDKSESDESLLKQLWWVNYPERLKHSMWWLINNCLPTRGWLQPIFSISRSARACILYEQTKENNYSLICWK